jgi:hypothetical protein
VPQKRCLDYWGAVGRYILVAAVVYPCLERAIGTVCVLHRGLWPEAAAAPGLIGILPSILIAFVVLALPAIVHVGLTCIHLSAIPARASLRCTIGRLLILDLGIAQLVAICVGLQDFMSVCWPGTADCGIAMTGAAVLGSGAAFERLVGGKRPHRQVRIATGIHMAVAALVLMAAAVWAARVDLGSGAWSGCTVPDARGSQTVVDVELQRVGNGTLTLRCGDGSAAGRVRYVQWDEEGNKVIFRLAHRRPVFLHGRKLTSGDIIATGLLAPDAHCMTVHDPDIPADVVLYREASGGW